MMTIRKELEEAGALPLDDDELDQASGGNMSVCHQQYKII